MPSRLEKGSNSERKVMLKLMQKELLYLENAKNSLFLIGSSFALLQPVIESAGLKPKPIMGWNTR
jgi:hypothetical protein